MSRTRLYRFPDPWLERVRALTARMNDRSDARARLLLSVELGFTLMEELGFDDEPVGAAWVLLSGMPMYEPRLARLTAEQRHALANARQLLPYSSRFAWRAALGAYERLPGDVRNYDLNGDPERLILAATWQDRQRANRTACLATLAAPLEFTERKRSRARADRDYTFTARTGEGTHSEPVTLRVRFSSEHVAQDEPYVWFEQPKADRPSVIPATRQDLREAAEFLDSREALLSESEGPTLRGNWVQRLERLDYRPVEEGRGVPQGDHAVEIRGFTNVAGMVAAGKSTLAMLLTVHILRRFPEARVTLVVSNVSAALSMAHRLNSWFLDDPERQIPVAVPLMGRAGRDGHARSLHASREFQEHMQAGRTHWGERWLGTACAVQALAPMQNGDRFVPLPPGREPCERLQPLGQDDLAGPGTRALCPFHHRCPARQLDRDIPHARVWVTTPGAMARGNLPRHLEARPLTFGELVYEQSDLVIFDEADSVMGWFDDAFALVVPIANGKSGVFDETSIPTAAHYTRQRVMSPLMHRWVKSQSDAQSVINTMLTLLDEKVGRHILRDWVERGYFTPGVLLDKLARRISGLGDHPEPDDATDGRDPDEHLEVRQWFDALVERDDPLVARPEMDSDGDPTDGLVDLLLRLNNTGDSADSAQVRAACLRWIERVQPDVEERLHGRQERLRAEQERRADGKKRKRGRQVGGRDAEQTDVDSPGTLALRLQFALTVFLLDQHTRVVFYEWDSRPPTVEGEQPHRRVPGTMQDILPLPPTGRQFGTYYARNEGEDARTLAMLAYTNVGREYLLGFHRLFTDLDGRLGPHVLTLSGTSYLPDSTSFHLGPPHALLMPEQSALDAISSSTFRFTPAVRADGTLIRVSGRVRQEGAGLFRELATALVAPSSDTSLQRELAHLQALSVEDPAWRDRARVLLLVNSYEQAAWAAEALRDAWRASGNPGRVYHLSHGGESESSGTVPGALLLADVEGFGLTAGEVLVAPMNAIGRGLNVLNAHGKAAFGSVYFLTRPYPHPHDAQALARELNARVLSWASDPNHPLWQHDGLLGRALAVRRAATRYWRLGEQRRFYSTLVPISDLQMDPRRELAATTAGLVIQACGRLLRGGVPFRAHFVDAAWAPNAAGKGEERRPDTPRTSLLAAMLAVLSEYADEDIHPIGNDLYKALVDAFIDIENFRPDLREEK